MSIFLNPNHPLRVAARKAKEAEEQHKIEEAAAFKERIDRDKARMKCRETQPALGPARPFTLDRPPCGFVRADGKPLGSKEPFGTSLEVLYSAFEAMKNFTIKKGDQNDNE